MPSQPFGLTFPDASAQALRNAFTVSPEELVIQRKRWLTWVLICQLEHYL